MKTLKSIKASVLSASALVKVLKADDTNSFTNYLTNTHDSRVFLGRRSNAIGIIGLFQDSTPSEFVKAIAQLWAKDTKLDGSNFITAINSVIGSVKADKWFSEQAALEAYDVDFEDIENFHDVEIKGLIAPEKVTAN